MPRPRFLILFLGVLLSGVLLCQRGATAENPRLVTLASSGKARQRIVVAADASERVRQAAATLARYLERMSGAPFAVASGDGKSGVAVGLPKHFPTLTADLPGLDAKGTPDPTRTEDYRLRSHPQGLHLLGASELAVEHAVWDLLHRLGYRQFFPGAAWEVVPKTPDLRIAVDAVEHPAFYSRRIWYGFGTWDYNAQPYAEWCARNRVTSGIHLNTGHAYDGILSRNRAIFDAHPEYLGLLGGVRKSTKFCIGNPSLRQLVVEDALTQLRQKPEAHSVSLDPSDGGGWCECDRCAALGSVTDRALTLANQVAEAANKEIGPRYVGMYAYSQHSPPPGIRVHPRVVISVATAFISGGFSVDQLLDGWRKQGATLGIREYYSVNTWDRDLPGQSRGSNLTYLKTSLPHFHQQGARFLSSESSDNWGPNGLGYYLAARMLWDVNEADRLDALKEDFLKKAFGPAREPMARFYTLIDGASQPLLSDDLIGRMYRALSEARQRTDDAAIRARIADLVQYTRYVDLYQAYTTATGAARQSAFEALIRHAYRMRKTMLVHTLALYRDLHRRDKSVTIPADCAYNVPEGKNPWKSSEPFTEAELRTLLAQGIERHPLLDFTPVAFGRDLQPADRLGLPEKPVGSTGLYSRGKRSYYTWVTDPTQPLKLTVRAGLVYGSRGPAKLALYPAAETLGQAVADAEVPPDKAEHSITLKTTFTGLHRIEVTDAAAGTAVTWPEGMPVTLQSSPDAREDFHGRFTLYFYVPRGTKTVGGYSSGLGTLVNGSGKEVHTFTREAGYFSVPVGPGEDGKLWQFRHGTGQRLLMTVPPYLARSPRELLLPAEVIERDSRP